MRLHYVFSSPVDKIVWGVSHQCYPHKILTGRKEAYISPEHYKDVTGFTNTKESVHDHFTMGYSSTSVSLALGLAKARDLSGGKENIIAVTGDGALSGGEIYEGLNFAGEYGKNLIVILNDNEQSVAENHGGLYKNLRQLRESSGESSHNFFISLGFEYRYLDTLEYGSARYDYHDFSVVIDEDSMSQDENKTAVKYLILRPNGHLYSKWDSKASLIF